MATSCLEGEYIWLVSKSQNSILNARPDIKLDRESDDSYDEVGGFHVKGNHCSGEVHLRSA